jgi:hypothetical protein
VIFGSDSDADIMEQTGIEWKRNTQFDKPCFTGPAGFQTENPEGPARAGTAVGDRL